MLNKSYAFKLGHSKSSIDFDFGPGCFELPNDHPMAEDLLLNLELAKVQAVILPFLENRSSRTTGVNSLPFQEIGEQALVKMRQIQERMEMVRDESPHC